MTRTAGWSSHPREHTGRSVPGSPELTETLRQAQRFGFFGAGSIEVAIARAEQYVDALADLPSGGGVLDLGAGGGLPGLVIAAARPDLTLVLLDRRQKRTDFLELAVSRLGFTHVDVRCEDAEAMARRIEAGTTPPFSAVAARGFGPPDVTLRLASACIGPGGRIIISEPPAGDRWDLALVEALDLTVTERGRVIRFDRRD
jgi:16S rRNA (guanine527-N7)-methyltransferase